MIEIFSALNQHANFYTAFACQLPSWRKQTIERKFNYYDTSSPLNILDMLIDKILDKCPLGIHIDYRKHELYSVWRWTPVTNPQHRNYFNHYLGVLSNAVIF